MTAERKSFWSERLPIDWQVLQHPLREPVPYHMNFWWFALGGTPLILFGIQVATGILLTFYYVPSPPEAFNSIRYIQEVVPFGWWIRGIHHWGATLMILTVWLHMLRVFFTGAYRRPRELNWFFGIGLLFLTLAFGFTGYSLIYNQLSFWATTVGHQYLQRRAGGRAADALLLTRGLDGHGQHVDPLFHHSHRRAADSDGHPAGGAHCAPAVVWDQRFGPPRQAAHQLFPRSYPHRDHHRLLPDNDSHLAGHPLPTAVGGSG